MTWMISKSVADIIEENDFTEFEELVWYAGANYTPLLGLIIERNYFFVNTMIHDGAIHNEIKQR